ncbi:LPS translocon maturation chaperone LptM [Lysobacter xanthus]
MKPITASLLALSLLGLAGCGNKGPLVLPTAPPAEQPAPVESPAPATPTPETLNDQTNQRPTEGDASEGGNTTPPSTPPAR